MKQSLWQTYHHQHPTPTIYPSNWLWHQQNKHFIRINPKTTLNCNVIAHIYVRVRVLCLPYNHIIIRNIGWELDEKRIDRNEKKMGKLSLFSFSISICLFERPCSQNCIENHMYIQKYIDANAHPSKLLHTRAIENLKWSETSCHFISSFWCQWILNELLLQFDYNIIDFFSSYFHSIL